MDEPEKRDYISRVKQWSDETFPALMALADSWEKVPVKDFDEGLRLASALMKARSYISVSNQYSAKRSLEKLNGYIREIRQKTELAKMSGRPANDKKHYRAIVPEAGVPQEDGSLKRREYKPEEVDGRTPEHLIQYIHILPAELQKKTQKFKDMYLALSEYRGRLEVLSELPNADKESMSELAEKAIKQAQEIRALWDEVDEAVAVANGAKPKEVPIDYSMELKRPGEYTKEEIESMLNPNLREACKKQRIEGNKKYVRRPDISITDDYKAQLELRIRELMEWEENIPKRAYSNCEKAGVIVPGFNDNYQSEVSDEQEEEED